MAPSAGIRTHRRDRGSLVVERLDVRGMLPWNSQHQVLAEQVDGIEDADIREPRDGGALEAVPRGNGMRCLDREVVMAREFHSHPIRSASQLLATVPCAAWNARTVGSPFAAG